MELPAGMREVEVTSTLDGSQEKCLVYRPAGSSRAPLLVGLHTWSADRFSQVEAMLPRCRQRRWALILPEFRGPNLTTNPRARQAGGSPLARQDIVDALDWAVTHEGVDEAHVFLLGGSGGGHMALLMAAHAPHRFTGISAWVPITDLAAWHGQNPRYAPHVEAVCGGPPGAGPQVDREYRQRSPVAHLEAMRAATLSVHHGRRDPSVPYTHTWRLAQGMEAAGAERFYCEVFDGGHEIGYDRAFAWFEALAGKAAEGDGLTG
ncbi:MAG: alpha/beta fold hydrolase [Candidatus Latescibacterota bacterium]